MAASRQSARTRTSRQKRAVDDGLRPLCVKVPTSLFVELEALMKRENSRRIEGRKNRNEARLPLLNMSGVVRRLLEFGAQHPEALEGSEATVTFSPEMEAEEAKLRAKVAVAATSAAETYQRLDALGDRLDLHDFIAGVGWERNDLHEFWMTGKVPEVRTGEFLDKVNAYLDTVA